MRAWVSDVRELKLCEGLFIGTKSAASDGVQLRELSITHVVNVGGGQCHFADDGVSYFKMQVEDSVDAKLELMESTAWIHEVLERGQSVLIHCMGCFSRSPAIAIAYLIRYRRLMYEEALELVRLQRSCCNPNKGFEKQLRKLERQMAKRKGD